MSKAGIGAIMLIIQAIGRLLGIDLPDTTIVQVTEAIWTIVEFVLLIWGQLGRKDLVAGIFRK